MQRLCLLLCFLFISWNSALFADSQDFDKEQAILSGLSKKSLKERAKFLEMAKYTNSVAVFEKLTQMYKVNNSIKEDVFYAMHWMNNNNDGIFSSSFAAAVKEEFFRLKALEWASKPHIFYIITCLSLFQEKPFPGYDSFVDYIAQNIDDILDKSQTDQTDPVKLKAEILGDCIFYFAKRNQPGYMQKLAEVFAKNEISEQLSIVELFTSKKDSSIFESFTQKLSQQSKDEYSGDLFNAYKAYAIAIDKTVPKNIQDVITQYEQLRRQKIKNILQGY